MKKYNRTILFTLSDIHSGHKLGLLNPETELQDEGTTFSPALNDYQQYLWDDVYIPLLSKLNHLAGKDEIVFFSMGDIAQGNKYPHEQITTRIADQFDIAYYNLLPLMSLKNIKTVRFVKSTGAHAFGEGSSDITVVNRFQERYKNKDIQVLYHGLANIDGFLIDYSHHGPTPGRRNWLKGNEARLYLKSLIMDDIQNGRTPPHLVLRGHYHEYIREFFWTFYKDIEYEAWITILPSMCAPDDFARQVTRSISRIRNGAIAFEIINGRLYNIHNFTNVLDLRTLENL